MVEWGDLFRWSKVVHLPDWAEALPMPFMAPSYLVFICLLPAAFATRTLAGAQTAILVSALISPLAPVAAFALDPLHQNRFLPANMVFHYAWILLFFCAVPALLAFLLRAAFGYASGKGRGSGHASPRPDHDATPHERNPPRPPDPR